ncbi:MAG: chemotaxis protein CheW [Campylobacteraceae bacterium]|nr:chemotaxis protein CheW [Campylobacteraceae bacterium]
MIENQTSEQSNQEELIEDDDLIALITSNADVSGQYVIFRNGFDGLYAINVAKVEELISLSEIEITKNSDSYSLILGISKIRGVVLPVVNFDRWLGCEAEESVYELVMICNYGDRRFGLIIKNVIGILSIGSDKMVDNSEKDPKTTFVVDISLSGVSGLCLIFDSDKFLMDVFPTIETKEIAKTHSLRIHRNLRGKILSSDDSAVIRGALKTAYEQLNIDYELFHNGAELLSRLKELEPSEISLIITDLEMPVMDGITLIENIREDKRYDELPIIVNTNMANDSVSAKCKALNVNHIISKLDVEDLARSIDHYAL